MDSALLALLRTFWLRPETALWRALDVQAMEGFPLEEPSLDFGCGDGLFSFLRAGGRLHPDFDAFESMGHLEGYFQNQDAFDHCEEGFALPVLREPSYRITCALDHKENLLKKTRPLGLYREWFQADGNGTLPFPDGQFRSLFCNILYWLDQPGAALREFQRVLQPGGRACLFVPNPRFLEASFYLQQGGEHAPAEYAFLSLLDRGRMAEIRQLHAPAHWEALIAEAGLQVERRTDLLSIPTVQMWDVGLRPLFPPLLRMARGLDRAALAPIKAEWVDILMKFLAPLMALDGAQCAQGLATFHCYWVRKEPA